MITQTSGLFSSHSFSSSFRLTTYISEESNVSLISPKYNIAARILEYLKNLKLFLLEDVLCVTKFPNVYNFCQFRELRSHGMFRQRHAARRTRGLSLREFRISRKTSVALTSRKNFKARDSATNVRDTQIRFRTIAKEQSAPNRRLGDRDEHWRSYPPSRRGSASESIIRGLDSQILLLSCDVPP